MRCLRFLSVYAGTVLSIPVYGQDGPIRSGEERFKFNLGGVLARSDTSLRLDGQTRGREFDLEDTLGLDKDRNTLDLEATWRFAARHRIGVRGFQLKRDAERTINETLQIEDRSFPINTTLRAESTTTFLLADYRYSFLKSERMELAGSLGVLGGRYEFRFQGSGSQTDVNKKITVPVPVIGARLDYFITPRWTASVFGQGIAFNIGDVDARAYYAGVSTEYMITRHIGVGAAYNLMGINLELEKSNFRGEIDLRTNNLTGFIQARF
jgi:hypothetical protein